ncbi:MerC domain-containing protein [Planctobacterium marinum]|uniref:MerC domain-containing protein n=1 Tax=Planctobacterium marinum TaxID=1631968 RepID=UPI002B4BC567|nr:MerC domain-containing protein [Planctobacterium marinum]MCC2606990.1 MerC domain-containing protein [Planctobacterium marinum]
MRDIIGTVLSSLCIVHCVLSAVLLVLGGTGVISATWHTSEIHLVFFLPVLLFATLSFPHARRQHGDKQPLLLGVIGLVLLTISLMLEMIWHLHVLETILTVIGGGILIYAHQMNRRLSALQPS